MPEVDYGALFDEHMADEFVLRDVDATMATMTDDPVVLHVPTSTGGRGVDGVRRFYADHVIGTFPDDFAGLLDVGSLPPPSAHGVVVVVVGGSGDSA